MDADLQLLSTDGQSDWHIFARRTVKRRRQIQIIAYCNVPRFKTTGRPWPKPDGALPERPAVCPSCLAAASESVSSRFVR